MDIGVLTANFKANVGEFMTDVGKAAYAMEQTEKRISKAMKTMNTAFASATGGIAIGAMIAHAVQGAGEAELATKKVEQVLRATAGTAGLTAKNIDDLAVSMRELTGIDDDVIKGGEAILLTYRKIGKEVFPDALEATLDISAALGTDLKSSAIQVGKALNDPTKGIAALSREGIQFDATQQKLIKGFQESGQIGKAQAIVLKEIKEEMGGVAIAARDTLLGALQELGTSLDDLGEATFVGSKGIGTLRLAVEETITVLHHLTDYVNSDIRPSFEYLGKELDRMFVGPLRAVKDFFKGTVNGFIGLANTIPDFVAYISETTKALLSGNMEAVKSIFENFKNQATSNMKADWIGGIKEAVGDLQKETKTRMDKIHESAVRAGAGVKGIGTAAVEASKDAEKLQDILRSLDLELQKKKALLMLDQERELALEAEEKVGKLFAKDAAGHAIAVAQVTQRMRELADVQSSIDRDKLIKSLQQELDQKAAILAKDNEWLVTLQAQQKVESLFPLDEDKRNAALQRVRDTLKEISDIEGDTKKAQLLKDLDLEYQKKQAIMAVDSQKAIQLEAQQKVEELYPNNLKKQAEALKEIGDQLRKNHELDSADELSKKLESLRQTTKELEAQWKGTQRQFELQKQLAELDKQMYLSPMEHLKAAAAISKEVDAQAELKKKMEDSKKIIQDIQDATGSYADKVDALTNALNKDKITVEQYDDTLKKLNDKTLKNVNKSVKDFSTNLANGLVDGIANGQKLTDIIKNLGLQLAKAGVQKFFINPLASAAGNYAQNFFGKNVLPQGATGGGMLGALLRKIYGPGATKPALAGSGPSSIVGSPVSPNLAGAPLPALSAGGQLAGPIGLAPGAAATKSFNDLGSISSELRLVQTMTPDGQAIRVDIAKKPIPKGFNPGGKVKSSNEDPDNIIPFLKTIVGMSSGGPAWRVIHPDCPCPAGGTGGKIIQFPGTSKPGATGSSVADAAGSTNDALQPITALLGILGLAGLLNAFKGGDSNKIPMLRDIEALLQDSNRLLGDILKKMCPCPPEGVTKDCTCPGAPAGVPGGSGSSGSGSSPYLPGAAPGSGANPGFNPLTGGVNGFGGVPGGGSYSPMVPSYGTFNPLQGYVSGSGSPYNASGGYSATGTVSGRIIGAGMPTTGMTGPWASQQRGLTSGFLPTSGMIGSAPEYDEYMRRAAAMQSAGNWMGGALPNQAGFRANSPIGFTGAPFYLQGSPYAGSSYAEPDLPSTVPGLTGGVNKAPMYAKSTISSTNNGIWERYDKSGWDNLQGPYISPNTQGAVARFADPVSDYAAAQAQAQAALKAQSLSPADSRAAGLSPYTGIFSPYSYTPNPAAAAADPMNQRLMSYWRGIGSSTGVPVPRYPGFADGGLAPARTPVYVGERGKELAIFDQPARIVPADKTQQMMNQSGGGSGVPQIQIINNGHPISHDSASWDGKKLTMTIGNLQKNAANHRGFQKQMARNTGVKPILERTG